MEQKNNEYKKSCSMALIQLGQTLKKRRLELKMTQKQLADKSELHINFVQGIENGKRNPSYISLICLCQALEIELHIKQQLGE